MVDEWPHPHPHLHRGWGWAPLGALPLLLPLLTSELLLPFLTKHPGLGPLHHLSQVFPFYTVSPCRWWLHLTHLVTLIDQGPTIICHRAPCLPLPFSVFIPLGGFSYHLHFTEKETVAHGDKVPCLESAKQRKELGFTPGILVTCSLSPQPRPSPQCLS